MLIYGKGFVLSIPFDLKTQEPANRSVISNLPELLYVLFELFGIDQSFGHNGHVISRYRYDGMLFAHLANEH